MPSPIRLCRSFVVVPVVAILSLIGPVPTSAENWPEWRGPDRDGVSHETHIAKRWSAEENVAWRLPLPGPAGATPVVWDDRIFLTSAADEDADGKDDDLVLLCVSTAGDEVWRRVISSGNRPLRGDEGNLASPSPSTDGTHVWCLMGDGILSCFDNDGDLVWQFDLGDRFGRLNIQFGLASTPVLDGERLYVQLIHGDGDPKTREATVACLDKRSGETLWKQGRPSDAHSECEHSYASPTIYRDNEREFLLTHGADYAVAHDLDDGHELWRCGGLNPKGRYNATLRLVASPLAVPGIIIVPSAKKGPVIAIDPKASGDITRSETYIPWLRARDTPDVPSPLYHDGLVYLCRENGNLICVDAKTGKEFYNERTVRDRHRASPFYADGSIYLTSRRGVVTVVKPGKSFEILEQNSFDEPTTASPIVANGTLYLRTFEAALRNPTHATPAP